MTLEVQANAGIEAKVFHLFYGQRARPHACGRAGTRTDDIPGHADGMRPRR